jgi:trans-aconitate methyltransferase
MKLKLPHLSLGRKKTLSAVYWQKHCQGYIDLLKDTEHYPSPYTKVMTPALLSLVNKYTTPKSRLIDIGSGEGYFTRQVTALNRHICGLDLSPEMVNEARRKDPTIDYQVKDIEVPAKSTVKYDLAFSNLVFHYIENIDIALTNVHEMLKKDGYFVVTVPHPCYYLQENFNWFQDETDTPYNIGDYFSERTTIRNIANTFKTHHIHRTIGSYLRIFIKNKFKMVDIVEPKSEYSVPITLKKIRKIPLFIIFVIQKIS